MACGTDQCGGETSSTEMVDEYGNLTLSPSRDVGFPRAIDAHGLLRLKLTIET